MEARVPRSKTATSTPRLSEYARAFVYPTGITKTVWTRVEAKGVELGLGFDWWQSQLGTVCLGYGPDGKYVATVGGIGMSIPRQVGKTYFVLAMLVILCILFPGLQVVWTAHHLRTSTKTFTTLRGMCRRKKIAPHVKAMRAANGEQQVEFHNGSMIMFGARSQGFGRGFDEIDVEVFDESQILDTKALEDMIAATNQARNPHGALLFFMGTPPRPTDPSEAFTSRREKALAGKAKNAVWLEIGAAPDSDPDDRSQWPLMNPSFPTRTPVESMERLRENLSDNDSWNREGRGVWDLASSSAAINPVDWAKCSGRHDSSLPLSAVGIAATLDLTRAALVGASMDDDVVQVKPLNHQPGTGWIVDRAKELQDDTGCAVVIDGRGPGAVLIPHLERAGVRLTIATTGDVLDACAGFLDAVRESHVRHASYHELDSAARAAVQRPVGDRWAWGRKASAADITPLEGATLAAWVLTRPPERVAPPPDIF
jgi:hypothetical protein